MRSYTEHQDPAEQDALLAALLTPEEMSPDTYVVVPLGQLLHEISVSLRMTIDKRTGQHRPGAAAANLTRTLDAAGYIRTKR